MLRLRVVQAEFGDCLILEYGTPDQPKRILIDGGPSGTYENHLRPVLAGLYPQAGHLEFIMLSHVDNDHITGLLDMLAELRQAGEEGAENILPLKIGALWHNAFSDTLDPQEEIRDRLSELVAGARSAGIMMNAAGFTLDGILEGRQLQISALALGIPINPGFPEGVVRVETAPELTFPEGLCMRVVGPNQKNLERLRKKWLKWLTTHEDKIAALGPQAAIAADQSIPNLSSIMVLVEESGRRLLLTGDGTGTDLLKGLQMDGLLDAQGRMHVDVLKMPHHGSARNITRRFLQAVTADCYVICANGMYGNPDYSVLEMLAECAQEENRKIKIFLTGETRSSKKLTTNFIPSTSGYQLTILEPGEHEMVLEIA